jgi:hypothetical protein
MFKHRVLLVFQNNGFCLPGIPVITLFAALLSEPVCLLVPHGTQSKYSNMIHGYYLKKAEKGAEVMQ